MKAIQMTIDERLLATLDRDAEVRRDGRSAVIRRALFDYLRRKRRQEIATAYQRAYGSPKEQDDFKDWAKEGVWPD